MLFHDSMVKCVLLDKKIKSDGAGGFTTEWTEGVEFNAAFTLDSSMQARIGEKLGVTGIYTVITPKALALDYHDVFKRLATKLDDDTELPEKIFRVTSKSDKTTPASAALNMRQCIAEEFELPV